MVEQDRKRWLFLGIILCALLCAGGVCHAGQADTFLSFIENRGQIVDGDGHQRPDIVYTTSQGDVTVFFRHTGISYVFAQNEQHDEAHQAGTESPSGVQEHLVTHRVDLELIGANPHASILPSGRISEYFNYYYPHCPQGIHAVPAYTQLVYKNIYENIDLVFYSRGNGLKYDFVVRPGGRVADIVMRYNGAGTPPVIQDGRLHVRGALGTIDEEKPYSYLSGPASGSDRRQVESRFVLRDGEIHFAVDEYDLHTTLVIDPGVLWATYYGGSLNDGGLGVATDAAGNIAVTGYTQSINFPVTPGALQSTLSNSSIDAFIALLSADGTRQWTTYYGGSAADYSGDYRMGIAVDGWNNIVIAGHTESTDFPVANAIQGSSRGNTDGFIAKFNSSGQRQWATYCGGGGSDFLRDVTTDDNGAVYVTGVTASDNFSTGFVFQNTKGGLSDAFWSKLGSDGVPVASYYFGGNNTDAGNAITVDNNGYVVIAGRTGSLALPGSTNGFQSTYGGSEDAFIARFNPNGSLEWSSYYGGNGTDEATGVVNDMDGSIIAVGSTASSNLSMSANALQPAIGGNSDAFVIRFFENGVRDWSTYYGGNNDDKAAAVRLDISGDIVLAGTTRSTNFPLSTTTYQENNAGFSDAFALRMSVVGERLLATYFGGNDVDEGMGVAADNGYVIVTGRTLSSNLPVTIGAVQKLNAGGYDAFITKFGECSASVNILPAGATTICNGGALQLNAGTGYSAYLWSNGATTPAINVSQAGTYAVTVVGAGGCQATDSITVTVNPMVMAEAELTVCSGDTTVLSVFAASSVGGLQYRWSPPDGLSCTTCKNPSVAVSSSKVYSVTVTDAQGCSGSTTVSVRVNAPPAIQVSPDTTICVGNLVPLFAAGGTSYKWSPREGLTCDTCQGPLASLINQAPTTYYVRITSDNGCTIIDSVTLYPKPVPQADAGTDTVVCYGQPVQLSASGGVAYRWEPADGLDCPTCARPMATLTSDREYKLTVTDAAGCTSQDRVEVRVLPVQPLVSPQPKINFGRLGECESSAIRSVIITNTSRDDINVRDLLFTDPSFSLVDQTGRPVPAAPFSLSPGVSDTLYCMFIPQQGGTSTGYLTLRAHPCNIEYIFELSGQKKSIAMTTGVSKVDMGTMLTCDASWKDTIITVRNTGEATLEVHASIQPPFSLVENGTTVESLSGMVRPGDFFNITVRFTPVPEGGYTGNLTLAYQAGVCVDTVRVGLLGSRTAPRLQAVAQSISFPPLLGCEAATDTVITLVNTGEVPLKITGADDNAHFRVGTLFPLLIPPGESRDVALQFRPSPPGVFNKTLTFEAEPCNLTVSVSLHGTMEGVSFTVPDTLTFADVILCRESSTATVLSLANISGGSVQGKVLSVQGSGPFNTSMQDGDIIGSGEVRDFDVRFVPSAAGTFTGKMDILLEPCDIVKTVWLRGKAVSAEVTAETASIDMGVIPVSRTSTRTLTFRNTGATDVTVSDLQGIVAPFSVVQTIPPLPALLQPGQELTVTVEYSGIATGQHSMTLTVVADAPCLLSDKTEITAETVDKNVAVIAGADLDFGTVQVYSSQKAPVVLYNTGTATGTLRHIVLEQRSDNDFTIDSSSWSLPAPLAVDGSFPIPIRFIPAVTGSRAARLRIETDAGTLVYNIVGQGIDKPHGTSSLMIPATLEADVQARDIHIPVYLADVQRLAEVNPTELELTIGFNETVFRLTDIAGCDACQRLRESSQNSEYKEVTFKIVPPFTSGAVLFELVGDALLGNSEYTDFVISDARWKKSNGIDMTTTVSNGRLTITGICHNGGDRLLENVGSFGIAAIRPNPSGGRVEITVNTVEYGETHLEIYSMYGQRAFSRVWTPLLNVDGNAASTETVILDHELPSGIYQVILTSPARVASRQLIIAK